MKAILLSAFLIALFTTSAQATIVTYHSGYHQTPYYNYPSAQFYGYYNSPSFSLSVGSWNNYWNGYSWVTPTYGYYQPYYPTAYYQPAYYYTNYCYWVGGYYYCN